MIIWPNVKQMSLINTSIFVSHFAQVSIWEDMSVRETLNGDIVHNVTVVNGASISWVWLNFCFFFSNNAVVIISDATAGDTL